MGFDLVQRRVGGAVVDEDDLHGQPRLRPRRREGGVQMQFVVKNGNDEGDVGLHGV